MAGTKPKIAALIIGLSFFQFVSLAMAAAPTSTPTIEQVLSCLPPSSLECTDQNSYYLLSDRLHSLGTAFSEIGIDQLNICAQQVKDYQKDLADYNVCSTKLGLNYNQSDILSHLGSYTCSAFLGSKGTFNKATNMCECTSGYVLYDSECKTTLEICQSKHGDDYTARSSNCIAPSATSQSTPTLKPTIVPTPKILKSLPLLSESPTKEPSPTMSKGTDDTNLTPPANSNAIMRILTLIGKIISSFFRNIF